jgi:NAD(P)-dependent dehydrogenase (short-subunit alcohol dehydrogenase family)
MMSGEGRCCMADEGPGSPTIARPARAGGDLRGRHLVVTGAGGALGGAVVDVLLEAGATCHAPVRAPGQLPARERLHVTPGIDLTDESAVTRFYAGLPALWGSVQVAGGFAPGRLADATLADLRGQLDRNLVPAFLCTREAVRAMRRHPGAGGRLVNVGSRASLVPAAGKAAYTASKAALAALTQALAVELRDEPGAPILANVVVPDTIDTAANRAAMPGADPSRWTSARDIAEAILWLVSPANTVVTGAIVPV